MDGDERNLLSINELSKISGMSRKNILYLEKIKLINADYVNDSTKYRYYKQDKIYLLEVIKHLKHHGLNPGEIKDVLLKDVKIVIKQLKEKKNFFLDEAEKVKKNISRIDALVETLETSLTNRKKTDYFFNIKEEAERTVIYKRMKSSFDSFSFIWRVKDLNDFIEQKELNFIEPYIAIFYDDYGKLNVSDADYAVSIGIKDNINCNNSNFKAIPAGLYASTVHIGNYESSVDAYNFLIKNIQENGYEVIGPTLKLYLIPLNPFNKTELVSEIQIQITKK